MGFLSNSIVRIKIGNEEKDISLRDLLKLIRINKVKVHKRKLSNSKILKYYSIEKFSPEVYVLCEDNKFLRVKEIHYYFHFGKIFEVCKNNCLIFDEFTELKEKLSKKITFSFEKDLFVGLIIEDNSFYYVNGILSRHI